MADWIENLHPHLRPRRLGTPRGGLYGAAMQGHLAETQPVDARGFDPRRDRAPQRRPDLPDLGARRQGRAARPADSIELSAAALRQHLDSDPDAAPETRADPEIRAALDRLEAAGRHVTVAPGQSLARAIRAAAGHAPADQAPADQAPAPAAPHRPGSQGP